MRRAAALAIAVVLMAACGSDQDPGVDIGTPTSAERVNASVVVTVTGGPERSGSVRCEGGSGVGTGFLLDQAAASAACALLLQNADAKRRLLEGPPKDQICTEIYGGPEVATVEGTIEGRSFKATINRADGCGIADWELLTPLLGPPG